MEHVKEYNLFDYLLDKTVWYDVHPIHFATAANFVDVVIFLQKHAGSMADIVSTDKGHIGTALEIAARKGHIDMMTLYDVNYIDDVVVLFKILYHIAPNNRIKMFQSLLDKILLLSEGDTGPLNEKHLIQNEYKTIGEIVVKHSNINMLQILLEKGFDWKNPNSKFDLAVLAVQMDRLDVIELLKEIIDLTDHFTYRLTLPNGIYTQCVSQEMMRYLSSVLEIRLNVNGTRGNYLHGIVSTERVNFDRIKFFLSLESELYEDIEEYIPALFSVNINQSMPLHCVLYIAGDCRLLIFNRTMELAQLFVSYDVDKQYGHVPGLLASIFSRTYRPYDIVYKDSEGYIPTPQVISTLIDFVLKNYPMTDVNSPFSDIPLNHACELILPELVQFFIDEGADVAGNQVALSRVCRNKHVEYVDDCLKIIKLLVENGADCNQNNGEGTPIMYATIPEIITYLYENGADPRAVNDENENALIHRAYEWINSIHGDWRTVPQLVKLGTDINQVDTMNGTSLHTLLKYCLCIEECHHIPLICTYIHYGADVTVRNNDGETWTGETNLTDTGDFGRLIANQIENNPNFAEQVFEYLQTLKDFRNGKLVKIDKEDIEQFFQLPDK